MWLLLLPYDLLDSQFNKLITGDDGGNGIGFVELEPLSIVGRKDLYKVMMMHSLANLIRSTLLFIFIYTKTDVVAIRTTNSSNGHFVGLTLLEILFLF